MDIFTQIERLEKLADVIEEAADHFDMRFWVRDPDGEAYIDPRVIIDGQVQPNMCGTVACLAGWAVSLWGAEVDITTILNETSDAYELFPRAGAQVLGLDRATADNLFDQDADHQTAEEAAHVLREMAVDIKMEHDLL